MRSLWVAFFANKLSNTPECRLLSWDRLKFGLTQHQRRAEKDGRLWSPTAYKPDTTRANENVESLHALVLDFDQGADWNEQAERWSEWEFVIYSTHNSKPELPKWRAAFPLASPVPSAEWPRVYGKLVTALAAGQVDPQCKDCSRMYYTPSCPVGATPFSHSHAGAWLDPSQFPDPAPEVRTYRPLPPQTLTPDERPTMTLLLDRALAEIGEGRHARSLWLSCQLRDNGYSEADAELVLREFVTRAPGTSKEGKTEAFTDGEALHNVRTAYSRAGRQPWSPRESRSSAPGPTPQRQPILPPTPTDEDAPADEITDGDTLPHSDAAETGLVAGVLSGASEVTLRSLFDLLTPPDCYYRSYDLILTAARDLLQDRHPINPETVALRLEEWGQLDQAGGEDTLKKLCGRRVREESLLTLAGTVLRKSQLRDRILMLREAEAACFQADANPAAIEDQLTRDLLLTRQNGGAEAVCYSTVVDRELDRLRNGVSEQVLGFGLQCVDRIVEGLEPGDVGIVCGRPGAGKSVYCAMQLHHGAGTWGPGLYLSLEMKAIQMVRRDFAGLTGLRYQEFRHAARRDDYGQLRPFSRNDLKDIEQAATTLKESGRGIWIDERACKLSQVVSRVHRYRLQHGIKFLVVDYGQLVRDDTRKSAGKAEEVMNVARALKNEIAMPVEIPVWVAVQANRESEKGDKVKTLQFRDLGWSSEWEAVASAIVFLNPHPARSNLNTAEKRHILLECQKNRNGGHGSASLILDGPRFRFGEDLTSEPYDPAQARRWERDDDD